MERPNTGVLVLKVVEQSLIVEVSADPDEQRGKERGC